MRHAMIAFTIRGRTLNKTPVIHYKKKLEQDTLFHGELKFQQLLFVVVSIFCCFLKGPTLYVNGLLKQTVNIVTLCERVENMGRFFQLNSPFGKFQRFFRIAKAFDVTRCIEPCKVV